MATQKTTRRSFLSVAVGTTVTASLLGETSSAQEVASGIEIPRLDVPLPSGGINVGGVPVVVFPDSPIDYAIKTTDVSVTGSAVTIRAPGIGTNAARYSDLVRAELGVQPSIVNPDFAPIIITPEQIEIGPDGGLIIRNEEYAAAANAILASAAADGDTNYCCNCNAYQCGTK